MTNEANTTHSRIALSLAALAAAILVAGGYFLWAENHGSVSTDDAQVDGHVHPVAARTGGTVVWVNPAIDDTKFVRAGTVLARLDTNDFQPAVDRFAGDVESQHAQLQSAELGVPITQATAFSKLHSSEAAVTEAEAELASARVVPGSRA